MSELKIKVNGNIITCKKSDLISKIFGEETPCGGRGICGKCKVKAKGSLSKPSERELSLLSKDELKRGIRLACLTYVTGPCEIETISPKNGKDLILEKDSSVVLPVAPAFKKLGVAVDIGTTTIAARLYDVGGNLLSAASALNPQVRWGSDVVTRIESAINGNAEGLRKAVVGGIDKLILELAKKADTEPYNIDGAVITGNTAMLCLLAGKSVEGLSKAPFKLDYPFGKAFGAKELDLKTLDSETKVYLPPCLSPFVGADITCGIVATELYKNDETSLLVDIGTNGEMCLWRGGKLYIASTAAGPAFEGVGISHGMRAGQGAINRVFLKDGKISVNIIDSFVARGICGGGLIEGVAALLELEIIDETGYMEENYAFSEGVELTPEDIRKIQMSKSAISAGIKTLLQAAKTEKAYKTLLAGGFGSSLNIASAQKIGLLPSAAENVTVVGNSALGGASMLLMNKNLTEKCNDISKEAILVELATSSVFSEHFMNDMMF